MANEKAKLRVHRLFWRTNSEIVAVQTYYKYKLGLEAICLEAESGMISRTERNSGSGPKLHDSGGNYRADCQAAVEKGEPRLVSNPEDAGARRKVPGHLRLDQQLTATKPEGGGGNAGRKNSGGEAAKSRVRPSACIQIIGVSPPIHIDSR
jgi:hypothetical protein